MYIFDWVLQNESSAGQIERGGYSSFYFSYGTDGPNSLEVNFGHRTCYFVNGYNNCYIWCFPISLHVSFIRGFRAVSTMCELVGYAADRQ